MTRPQLSKCMIRQGGKFKVMVPVVWNGNDHPLYLYTCGMLVLVPFRMYFSGSYTAVLWCDDKPTLLHPRISATDLHNLSPWLVIRSCTATCYCSAHTVGSVHKLQFVQRMNFRIRCRQFKGDDQYDYSKIIVNSGGGLLNDWRTLNSGGALLQHYQQLTTSIPVLP